MSWVARAPLNEEADNVLASHSLNAPVLEAHVELYRRIMFGLSDREIVDANQVVSYFNYVNRVADGLGVELEDYWPEELRRPRTYDV